MKHASELGVAATVTDERIEVPCRECGSPQDCNKGMVEDFGMRSVVCDDCCNAFLAKQHEESAVGSYKAPITDFIPQLYLETEFNELPAEARNIWRYGYQFKDDKKNIDIDSPPIQQWQPSPKGIYILGASRTGKTRTLCILLKRLYEQGVKFKLFQAGQFHASLVEAKKSNISSAYSRWRNEQINVPVLAIDDLFAEKMTETIQAGLFEVIEQRMARKLPILITTQVKRAEAVKQFNDPLRGEALLNRLRESSDLYITNQPTKQEELKIQ